MTNDPFNFENVRKTMDDINELTYGVRPFGTERQTEQEATLSEMVGMPVKIQHD